MSLVVPVVYERWQTAQDERVCGRCGPLHGQVFVQGQGPVPPLHRGCRCQRVHAGILEPLPISMPEPPPVSDVPEPVLPPVAAPPRPEGPRFPWPFYPGEERRKPPGEDDMDWLPPVVRGEP